MFLFVHSFIDGVVVTCLLFFFLISLQILCTYTSSKWQRFVYDLLIRYLSWITVYEFRFDILFFSFIFSFSWVLVLHWFLRSQCAKSDFIIKIFVQLSVELVNNSFSLGLSISLVLFIIGESEFQFIWSFIFTDALINGPNILNSIVYNWNLSSFSFLFCIYIYKNFHPLSLAANHQGNCLQVSKEGRVKFTRRIFLLYLYPIFAEFIQFSPAKRKKNLWQLQFCFFNMEILFINILVVLYEVSAFSNHMFTTILDFFRIYNTNCLEIGCSPGK